jgi:hypothetical protein
MFSLPAVASTATATMVAAAATAAGTGFPGLGFVNGKAAPFKVSAVEFVNGRLGFFLRTHFHETKAS